MKKVKLISEREFFDSLGEPSLKLELTSKVVMHATETCYGLAADIFNQTALNQLYKIKKMSANKLVSMMVLSILEAEKYVEFNDVSRKLADKFWPGPLTLVLPRKVELPEFFNRGSQTIGVRVPDSKVSQALIKLNGRPLTTTSANVSGRPEVYKVLDYLSQLKEHDVIPDLVIDGGTIEQHQPSTVIKIVGEKWEIIRKGEMVDEITQFLVQLVN